MSFASSTSGRFTSRPVSTPGSPAVRPPPAHDVSAIPDEWCHLERRLNASRCDRAWKLPSVLEGRKAGWHRLREALLSLPCHTNTCAPLFELRARPHLCGCSGERSGWLRGAMGTTSHAPKHSSEGFVGNQKSYESPGDHGNMQDRSDRFCILPTSTIQC